MFKLSKSDNLLGYVNKKTIKSQDLILANNLTLNSGISR